MTQTRDNVTTFKAKLLKSLGGHATSQCQYNSNVSCYRCTDGVKSLYLALPFNGTTMIKWQLILEIVHLRLFWSYLKVIPFLIIFIFFFFFSEINDPVIIKVPLGTSVSTNKNVINSLRCEVKNNFWIYEKTSLSLSLYFIFTLSLIYIHMISLSIISMKII